MTHPLTDEILRDILEAVAKETEEDSSGWFEDDLMRAAADWQLEQVLEWLRTTPRYHCPSVMAQFLEEAMRPQQDKSL